MTKFRTIYDGSVAAGAIMRWTVYRYSPYGTRFEHAYIQYMKGEYVVRAAERGKCWLDAEVIAEGLSSLDAAKAAAKGRR